MQEGRAAGGAAPWGQPEPRRQKRWPGWWNPGSRHPRRTTTSASGATGRRTTTGKAELQAGAACSTVQKAQRRAASGMSDRQSAQGLVVEGSCGLLAKRSIRPFTGRTMKT